MRFSFARQTAPLGLGHAVWCARHLIGDEPFAVLLPDDLLDGEPPVLAQMIETFQRSGASVIAVENVRREDTARYGIVEPRSTARRACAHAGHRREAAAREGAVDDGASSAAMCSLRGCSTAWRTLSRARATRFSSPMRSHACSRSEPVFAYSYIGKRYDCGSKLGFLEATLTSR